MIAFGLDGSREDAVRFMDRLKFICIVTHVADARTCVLHPASHTHRQLSDEQLREAGVAPDLIRLSVGIENAEDILSDLEQALEGCKETGNTFFMYSRFLKLNILFNLSNQHPWIKIASVNLLGFSCCQ